MGVVWRAMLGLMILAAGAAPALAQEATPAPGAGCTAGSSGIGDGYFPIAGNGGYDVAHYDLDLRLDVAAGAIVAARAAIDALATEPLCRFNLDFRGLEIDGVAVNGAPAAFTRRDPELTVVPAAPLPAGVPFTVAVAYHGAPIGQRLRSLAQGSPAPSPAASPAASPAPLGGNDVVETGGAVAQQFGAGWFTTGDSIFIAGEPTGAEGWYPVNGHPADKATYTLRLTVPKPSQAVANGALQETVDRGDATTFVYASRDPIASYLVTFHVGPLDVERLSGPNGLPITLAFAPSTPEYQRAAFRRLPEILDLFTNDFGPYPFESAGATVAGASIPFALETQTLPIFGAASPGGASPSAEERLAQILAHETSHQWFGDSVSLLRWEDIWLNEGFATYAEALWLEHTGGVAARDRFLQRLEDEVRAGIAGAARGSAADVLARLETYFGLPADDPLVAAYLAGLGATSPADLAGIPASRGIDQLQALGVPAAALAGPPALTGDPGPTQLFSPTVVYARGGLTLHALRQEVGDETFFAILKAWAARYRHGNATTSDFIALAEEVSGRDLNDFFRAWLFQTALPS